MADMRKMVILPLLALIIVSGAFAYHVATESGSDGGEGEPVAVALMVNFSNGTVWQHTITLEKGEATVFNVLMRAAHENGFAVESTYFGQYDSYFVDAIAGVGGEGKYWLYYVNGEMGMVGADKMMVKEGDMIEWRLEEFR